jgi:signal transduction histidine kinase/integral membrane sensor domain MASE1
MRRTLARAAAVAALYCITAWLGLSIAFVHDRALTLWPPAGIAVAAVLLWGDLMLPAVGLAAFATGIAMGLGPTMATGLALGHILEAYAAARILRSVGKFHPSLDRVRDVLVLIGPAAFLAALLAASVAAGAAALTAAGAPRPGGMWWRLWLGHAMGIVLVAPVALTWLARPRIDCPLRRTLEALGAGWALILVGAVAFIGPVSSHAARDPLMFLVFPLMVWIALRYRPREVATGLFVIAVIAALGTAYGSGPFSVGASADRLLLLHGFLLAVALASLTLAASKEQSRSTLRSMHASEQRFRTLTALSSDWYFEQDAQFRFKYLVRGVSPPDSIPLDQFRGKTRWDLPGVMPVNTTWDEHRAVLAAHQPFNGLLLERKLPGGGVRYVNVSAVPLFDAHGRFEGYRGIGQDVTERTLSARAHERTASLLRATLEATADGILVIDLSGRMQSFNRKFAQMWRIPDTILASGSDDTALAWVCDQVVEPRNFIAGVRQLYADMHAESFDVVEFKDGRVFERYSRPQRQDGEVVGRVWSFRDVTERKQAEEAVRQLNAELERRVRERTVELESSNRELEAFSYSVAHDLRAPLRAMDGYSKILLDDSVERMSASEADCLQRIRAGAQRMAELIDALLALSRMTRIQLSHDRIDLALMAHAIRAELQQQQPQRSVEFLIADGMQATGDGRLLRVALENLLGNAWKFTHGVRQARIEFCALNGDDGLRTFVIRDNGAGFDMEYANKLFTAFQRLHHVSEFSGIGIGLATVRRIVERHGGQVWANAQTGAGASFYFTLPP